MNQPKVIDVHESIFAPNGREADDLRRELKQNHTFLLNVRSSPGAGKTTLLINLINRRKSDFAIGVRQADIDSSVDAISVAEKTGAKSIQVHTGGRCHLDATRTKEAITALDEKGLDFLILENVGNLVCPAEFDTGASRNRALLSIPEGDDKPEKYPLMFEKADVVVITKRDTKEYFDFDFGFAEKWIKKRNPDSVIIKVSAKSNEGRDELAKFRKEKIERWNK